MNVVKKKWDILHYIQAMCCPDLTENEAHLHILTVLETTHDVH